MMEKESRKIFWWDWAVLLLIILVAAFFRWRGLNWDQLQHYHPDERYISWVASSVDFLRNDSFVDAFTADESTFNPFYWPADVDSESVAVLRDEPRKFAYGHFPLYMGVAAENGITALFRNSPNQIAPETLTWYTNLTLFDRVTLVGRWMSGLYDLLTVVVVFLLGRSLAGTRVGLVSAALLAGTVMHIQQAHFFISDPAMAFFVTLTILLLVWSLPQTQEIFDTDPNPFPRWLIFAGITTGLAIGSKFSAIMLGLPALFVILILSRKTLIKRLIMYGLIVLVTFFVTNPFAILDTSCPLEFGPNSSEIAGFIPGACYFDNISAQNVMVNGGNAFPFIRQYDGTLAYLYHIENQINWGMGAALGYVGFLAFGIFTVLTFLRGVKEIQNENFSSIWVKGIVVLGWCVPYFLTTGQFHTKFMRYLLPLSPFIVIFAAWLLNQIRWDGVRRAAVGLVVGFTFVYAIAFSSIYSRVHPWHAASLWMINNVPSRSIVVNEAWDEYLPSPVMIDGRLAGRDRVVIQDVNWLSKSMPLDTPEKLEDNLETLANADFFVIPSNRSYGVVPRLGRRYPISGQFHQLLFDGKLGYEVAFVQDRPPKLGPLHLVPHLFNWPNLTPPEVVSDYYAARRQLMAVRADESFTVYDQPTVMIFRNTGNLTVEEMLEQFNLPNR